MGIGVSSGALDALLALFAAMPPRPGLAFVVVLDGQPSPGEGWPGAVAQRTSLPVHEVGVATAVEPNAIYLAPPQVGLAIEAGVLRPVKRVRTAGLATVIDQFFAALASDAGERAIGVVLSGSAPHCAAGLQDIKDRGGLTIVEEPSGEIAERLPRSAFATAHIDMILPVARIPEKLVSYARHSYLHSAAGQSTDLEQGPDDEDLLPITELLRHETTHDFRRYRKNTLRRRIQRRMGLNQVEQLADYLELLRGNRVEIQALRRDLLICVTRFFRDAVAWDVLRHRVLRELAVGERGDSPLRAWVPGCATGEEAYTLAMLFHEQIAAAGSRRRLQIFATDVAEDALDVARAGIYPPSIENDVSAARLEMFFTREGDQYRVSKRLRESVVFAEQNVLAQPPFSRLDLVCCRNLLIYLEPEAQQRVMIVFQYALKEGGTLFLGNSETIGAAKPLFVPVSKKWRIFRRTGVLAAPPVDQFSESDIRLPLLRSPAAPPHMRAAPRVRGIADRVQRQLLTELERGIAVVDAQNRLLYLHGSADLYLQLSLGDVPADQPDVLRLAREGLRSKLRAAIRQARLTQERVTADGRVLRDGRFRRCSVTVRPLDGGSPDEGTLFISFEPGRDAAAADAYEVGGAESSIVRDLQHELASTREQLNSTIEDLEAANDGLKASHEEAMSMNEELQSGNEELETSKEELQSLNEELITLNHQLETKVAELQSTTADLDNVLTSSQVPTLILDTSWRIRRYTPSCQDLFHLIATDVGRPLTDIASAIEDPDLLSDARAVLGDLRPRERQVSSTGGGRHYQRQVLPYRTGDDRIQGVVLTYADVTELRRTTEKLRRREHQQKALARFGQLALTERDPGALMGIAVQIVRDAFEAEFVKLLELLPDGRSLLMRAGSGWRDGVVGRLVIDKESDSQAAYTLTSNEPVVVRNLDEDSRFKAPALLIEHGVVSGLSTVIRGQTGPIGVLGVHTTHEAKFTVDDIDFVESVAHVLSKAILLGRSEQAVRAAEERLRLATDAVNLGTWDYDPEGDLLVASPRSKQLFSLPPDAVIRYRTYLERVHAIDRRRVDDTTRRCLDPRSGGHCELEYRTAPGPDGTCRWIRDIRQTFFEGGRAVRMIGTLEDVTQRKEAEQADLERLELAERLRRIAEATPGTIFTFRLKPGAVGPPSFPYTAPNVRDTWGLEPEDIAEDAAPLFDRIHPEDGRHLERVTQESAANMSMWHGQFRYDHPSKGQVWIESYASPVAESDGTILWHGIAHDITELKQAELELRKARSIAEAADRAKGEFLANMSHEIRTPMSAILGYAEILSGQLKDPDNLQSLDTIRSNGLYLLEIIDDILDLSRIEAGKLELDKRRVRPDALAWEVQSLLKLHAAEKGLALEVEFDGRLPETIETDATRLKQILINLVENAIKFTDEGEVRIVVRLLAPESRIRFDVVDTGPGIPDETLARLFQPFTQADSSVTRRFGGSGLGLSICRALSRMLGGDVTVETAVGQGSRFTVTIGTGQLKGVSLFEPQRLPGQASAAWAELRALHGRVLVVDDRRDMRYLAQHMLEEAGAHVTLAGDGREALARVADAEAQGRPFDAVLLDMQMPVLDGYAAARELRSSGYDKAIIALTANAMKADERKCLESGCDDYLSKPLGRATLVNSIAYYTQEVSPQELAARRRLYGFGARSPGTAEAGDIGPRETGGPDTGAARGAGVGVDVTGSIEANRANAGEAPDGQKRVLLVDDNQDSCTLLRMLLQNIGCEVAIAMDAAEALASAASSTPDVAVIDLGLPGMPGDQLVAEMRARPELGSCRFICLSGRHQAEIDWRAAGFDHFLQKPARFDTLKKLIGN